MNESCVFTVRYAVCEILAGRNPGGLRHRSALPTAQPPPPAKADAAKGATLYDSGDAARGLPACVSCHGAAGNSTIAANPKLAGQVEAYTHKQLVDFTTPNRNNPVMTTYAKMLTDDEKRNVAAYLGVQKPSRAPPRTRTRSNWASKIYRGGIADKGVAACASCHGANGGGIPSQYPRLAGQHQDYTVRPAAGVPHRRAQEQRADDDAGQAHVRRRNEGRGRLHRRPEVSSGRRPRGARPRQDTKGGSASGLPFLLVSSRVSCPHEEVGRA